MKRFVVLVFCVLLFSAPNIFDKSIRDEKLFIDSSLHIMDEDKGLTKENHSSGSITVEVKLTYDMLNENSNRKFDKKDAYQYFYNNNKAVLDSIETTFSEDVYVSKYSNYLVIEFTDKNVDDIVSDMGSFLESEKVSSVSVFQRMVEPDAVQAFPIVNLGDYSMYSGLDGYDGSGVTIGIWEGGACWINSSGLIDPTNANFDTIDFDSYYLGTCPETGADHATLVGSLAAGELGIARGANVRSSKTYGSYIDELDYFVDEDTNIINASFSLTSYYGEYINKTELLDKYARLYDILFVISSGNTDDSNYDVNALSIGGNVLSIGNSQTFPTLIDELDQGSRYDECSNCSEKPNLIAPGQNMYVANAGMTGTGTSFSAPIVTGIAALLMEKYPNLKNHPELVISILQTNADLDHFESNYNSIGDTGMEEHVGAGLVDAQSSLDNGVYSTYVPKYYSDEVGDTLYSLSFSAEAGDELIASYASLVESDCTIIGGCTIDYSRLNLVLYDSNNIVIGYIEPDYSNYGILRYTFENDGNYTLKLKVVTNSELYHESIGFSYRFILTETEPEDPGPSSC